MLETSSSKHYIRCFHVFLLSPVNYAAHTHMLGFVTYKTRYLYKPESLMTNVMQLSELMQSPVKDNVFRSYLSNIGQSRSSFIEIDDKAKV